MESSSRRFLGYCVSECYSHVCWMCCPFSLIFNISLEIHMIQSKHVKSCSPSLKSRECNENKSVTIFGHSGMSEPKSDNTCWLGSREILRLLHYRRAGRQEECKIIQCIAEQPDSSLLVSRVTMWSSHTLILYSKSIQLTQNISPGHLVCKC